MSPFDTAGLRAAVLAAWAASPARFREDANAEELLATSYAGRVIAELAANGADAARSVGTAGEIDIRLVEAAGGRELRVANTGAPLSAEGVAALSSLRASAKRHADAVGRFGVGFTAVRALTDEPAIISTTGAVRFSTAETRRVVAELAARLAADPDEKKAANGVALAAELEQREGVLPILRLPWSVTGEQPLAGYVTEVRLPLRTGIEPPAVTPELAADLLWALPAIAAATVPGARVSREDLPDGLARITVHSAEKPPLVSPADSVTDRCPRSVTRGSIGVPTSVGFSATTHRTVTRSGHLPAALTADLPVEQRGRTGWQLTWVAGFVAPTLVGAPTATAEQIAVPARLIATLPVDEARGGIQPGPLTDFLIGQAADAYVDLVRSHPAAERIALLPAATFPLGAFDAALREAIGDRLATAAILTDAAGAAIRPDQAILIPGVRDAAQLAEILPGLVTWPERADDLATLRGLGARVEPVSTATAALAGIDRPPEFWLNIYDALADQPADDLADLPIPRRGGGILIGARGVLAPASHSWTDRAARLIDGLRLAAVDHTLLHRLGAEPAHAAVILDDPATAAAIDERYEAEDPAADGFAELICELVADAADPPAALGKVLLTDTDGEFCPAAELLLPGAPLAELLAADVDLPVVGQGWIDRFGAEVLTALGVRSTLTATLVADLADLPDAEDWQGEYPGDDEPILAIRDLDYLDEAAWPEALALIAADPDTARALRPTPDGPAYTAWWISRFARFDGRPARQFRLPSATELTDIYDEFPLDLPAHLLTAIGVLGSIDDAARDAEELLRRWADPHRHLATWQVPAVTAALVDALAELPDHDLPAGVRTLTGAVIDEALVLDQPMFAQVCTPGELVAGGLDPARTAEVLDLPLASESLDVAVAAVGAVNRTLREFDGAAAALAVAGRPGLARIPVTVCASITVTRRDPASSGDRHQSDVTWWIDGDTYLFDGSDGGLARLIAHLAGRWGERDRLAAAIRGTDLDVAEAAVP